MNAGFKMGFRLLFHFAMILIAIYFVKQSFDDWEASPVVTSGS
jgi:hypothetical protein